MVSNSKARTLAALILNLALIAMEIITIRMMWHVPMAQLIVFYTEDSNLFALAASIVMVCSILIRYRKGEMVPQWVRTFRYIATCLLTVTFLTVVHPNPHVRTGELEIHAAGRIQPVSSFPLSGGFHFAADLF